MTAETVTSQTATGGPADLPAGDPPASQVTASLSPSRAADFKTCPLLYRFRSIDRLPERPSVEQARGTLVHAVLERLFDLPAPQRTPAAAGDLVAPQWDRLVTEQAELAEIFTAGDLAGPAEFLASARELLDGYFTVEDPRRLEPAERESLVSTVVDDQLLIRGYIDRLDVSPDGALRVVDYKTGGAPREAFEARALFQLKFYALVLWRTRGVVPRVLRLLYLRDAEVCDYTPDAEELVRFERTVLALWRAIEQATRARDFRPKPSRLCDWCNHQAHCPAFGGTPPPFPESTGSVDPGAPIPPPARPGARPAPAPAPAPVPTTQAAAGPPAQAAAGLTAQAAARPTAQVVAGPTAQAVAGPTTRAGTGPTAQVGAEPAPDGVPGAAAVPSQSTGPGRTGDAAPGAEIGDGSLREERDSS